MTTIFFDYPDFGEFWEFIRDAYSLENNNSINQLIARKISKTAWQELGGDEYLNEKNVFYCKLKSRLSIVHSKVIRKEDIIKQVYKNLPKFLTVSVVENNVRSQNTKQDIAESQQPIHSLADMSSGSYGAYKNRADWLEAKRKVNTQISEGLLNHYEYEKDKEGKVKRDPDGFRIKKLDSDGNPIKLQIPVLEPNQSKKQIEERRGVGAILNALQFLENDLLEDLQEIRRDLMSPFDFGGKIVVNPFTGQKEFKSWEVIEEESDPEATERKKEFKEFRYDKNLSYPENLRNREVVLKQELKITRDKDLVQQKLYAGECFIEAWEKPIELKTREEFDKIKEKVIGFEEFIEEIGNYLDTVRKKRKSGKQILPSQKFYLLLGPPGIGKSYIAKKIAEYLGKTIIGFNCAETSESDLIGDQRTYRMAGFGRIAKEMMEARDRSPVIFFDEIDKCRDENVLNQISILFDKTINKHDFRDNYYEFPIPVNEVFFIATANDLKKLMEKADFVLSRCTQVTIKPLTYDQRIELAKLSMIGNLQLLEMDGYIERATKVDLLKKCLVKENGIRQTNTNSEKIAEQIDALDTKHNGNIPSDIDFVDYEWIGLIVSDGLDPNCPASRGDEHIEDHKCFEPKKIPGWEENMGE